MTEEQIMNELQALIDYFDETTGACPVCLIEAKNKINQYMSQNMYERKQYEKGYSDGELAENSRLFKFCDTFDQVKAIVADYYETVAEARSTYVRTEASKIWLADAIIDLFKDEFKEAENE